MVCHCLLQALLDHHSRTLHLYSCSTNVFELLTMCTFYARFWGCIPQTKWCSLWPEHVRLIIMTFLCSVTHITQRDFYKLLFIFCGCVLDSLCSFRGVFSCFCYWASLHTQLILVAQLAFNGGIALIDTGPYRSRLTCKSIWDSGPGKPWECLISLTRCPENHLTYCPNPLDEDFDVPVEEVGL